MDLQECRREIDGIDDQLISLFARRMELAGQVAAVKAKSGKAILDPQREREKLLDITEKCPEQFRDYAAALYPLIFELSRGYQSRLLGKESRLVKDILSAVDSTPRIFPQRAKVACQGVEGAYSQIACQRLFRLPDISYFSSFDGVFSAIEQGLCRYGIIPLENSTAGSVNKVYDLMMKHSFKVVRSVRIKVDHDLLVKPGTKAEDIREIFSHQQALSQCANYLQKFPGARLVPCQNTALAAKMVAEGDGSTAALSSHICKDLYGLECLESSVQDMGNNYTRFICISRDLEIYPGADRSSLMLVLPHSPGALYKVLSRFYALGINLNKLESRPIPGRDFEFMFYFDLDTPVYSPSFIQLMGEMEDLCEQFQYLGSYSEVI